MNRTLISKAMVGWTAALAISALACGSTNQFAGGDANKAGERAATGADAAGAAGTAGTADTAAKDHLPSPVTLTGCLQKGDGRNDYILTERQTTRTAVGTSGSAPSGSSADEVAREQMRSALHAYRLNGDHDSLEALVGKQIRVSGTLAKRSDLNDRSTAGTKERTARTAIDEGDLAKVDVASIDSVADNCGGTARSR
jgi:hypothetical protein